MEWLTTTTVLDRLRDSRDDSAWSSFVERYRAPITGFAMKCGLARPDAEDIAQETLAAFQESFRKNAYERGRGRLGSYLFGIAHNKILLLRRKMAARGAEVPVGDGNTTFWAQIPGTEDAQKTWELEWRQSILLRCLEQVQTEVTPQTFEAFRLVVLEQVEPAVAAERLGITRNAVFIAKHRVGTRLREMSQAFDEE